MVMGGGVAGSPPLIMVQRKLEVDWVMAAAVVEMEQAAVVAVVEQAEAAAVAAVEMAHEGVTVAPEAGLHLAKKNSMCHLPRLCKERKGLRQRNHWREHRPKEYLVPFPSPVELKTLVAIKRIPTDNNEGILYFEEWNQEIKPKRKLHQVWVFVYGVPHEIRSFLPLWAIGTTLGATEKVDMNYLRKHGVVRILVNVLDAYKIPNDTEIVVKGYMYPIFFKVDEIVSTDEELLDDEDLLDDDFGMREDQTMEDAKPSKDAPTKDLGANKMLQKNQEGQQTAMDSHAQLQLGEKALDMAVNRLMDEISLKAAMMDVSSDRSEPETDVDKVLVNQDTYAHVEHAACKSGDELEEVGDAAGHDSLSAGLVTASASVGLAADSTAPAGRTDAEPKQAVPEQDTAIIQPTEERPVHAVESASLDNNLPAGLCLEDADPAASVENEGLPSSVSTEVAGTEKQEQEVNS
ncbi:hypothetical protein PR202_gb25049 [Eleusine coracana subsp. coracana]|uniref:DUF4283 domain-containing protein n=1 Tax=Eleusine coracana subsp. coracana TaxID=191504 RepID=A0AAV5FKL8_ELECO|nr:hypothetical protein PR202_gb25049 [Eleusine coracana subsp. coracana]